MCDTRCDFMCYDTIAREFKSTARLSMMMSYPTIHSSDWIQSYNPYGHDTVCDVSIANNLLKIAFFMYNQKDKNIAFKHMHRIFLIKLNYYL